VEEVAQGLEVGAYAVDIDYISVVCQGEAAGFAGYAEGLEVFHAADIGRGIADVAYADAPLQAVEFGFRENVFHQSCTFEQAKVAVIAGRSNAAALLTSVLQTL
jgi:hypothetical protein